jgi:hypothetical protein
LTFYGNYITTTAASPVDTVEIEIRDTDRSKLRDNADLILNATRSLSKELMIEVPIDLIRGHNLIKLPRTSIRKVMDSPHIFDHDYLLGTIAKSDFFVESRKSVKIDDLTNKVDKLNAMSGNSSSTPTPDLEFFVRDYNLLIRILGILLNHTDPPSDDFRKIGYTSWMGRHLTKLRNTLALMDLDMALTSAPERIDRYMYAQILGADNRDSALKVFDRASKREYESTHKTIMLLLGECTKTMSLEQFTKCMSLIAKLEADIDFFRDRFIDATLRIDQQLKDKCTYLDIYLIRRTFIGAFNKINSIEQLLVDGHMIDRELRRLEYDCGMCQPNADKPNLDKAEADTGLEVKITTVAVADDEPIDKLKIETTADTDDTDSLSVCESDN